MLHMLLALIKSFQNEWTFLQWVVAIAGCDHAFRDLKYT